MQRKLEETAQQLYRRCKNLRLTDEVQARWRSLLHPGLVDWAPVTGLVGRLLGLNGFNRLKVE